MVSDTDVITTAVQAVLSENTKPVDEYKSGNQKVLGFLVGQVMKKLGGKADPQIVNRILMDNLLHHD
jgi:aspartyl-tRNA(Asn)/glutamyl-tRNA(Gln) amidotransferase subunit B